MDKKYGKIFEQQSVWRSIFSMAVPALLTIVIMIFYNVADMFFIAQLGDSAKVASVSVVSPVYSMIMALATMIGAGGSSVIANEFGAGNIEKAKTAASLCFYGAIVFGVLVTALIFAIHSPLLTILGTTMEMRADSRLYMLILASGAVFMLLSSSMGMLLRSEGAVKEGMYGNLMGTFVNLGLDPLFILIFGWGVAGAAIATVIGNMVSTLYYVVFIKKHAKVLAMDARLAASSPRELVPVMLIGLPNAASTILSGFAATFANNLLALHGTDAIAAAAAAGKTSMVISMVQMGICMGVQPLMAYSYGAANYARLKEVLGKTALLTGVIGAGTMLLCFTCRHSLIGLFLKEAHAAAMGEQYIVYVMAGAPFLGIVYISTNYLQAAQKAKGAIVLSLLRQGLLLIPLLYIFHRLFGFTGLAAAHMAADMLAALCALILFFKAAAVLFGTAREEAP